MPHYTKAAETNWEIRVYVILSDKAPGDMLCAYEPLKINGGEGANVLYVDSHVAWVTPERLKKDLAKTHKWLAKNDK